MRVIVVGVIVRLIVDVVFGVVEVIVLFISIIISVSLIKGTSVISSLKSEFIISIGSHLLKLSFKKI